MLALNRRAFVLKLAAVSVFGLPSIAYAGTCAVERKNMFLLGRRNIPLLSTSVTIPLRKQQYISDLVVRTEAGGYWLDRVELTDAYGIHFALSIRRRVLPRLDLDLALDDMPPHGWTSLILHHAYLPFSTGRASIEIWAQTA